MITLTTEEHGAPISFANIPTLRMDGMAFLTDQAADVLSDLLAGQYAPLLDRLSRE